MLFMQLDTSRHVMVNPYWLPCQDFVSSYFNQFMVFNLILFLNVAASFRLSILDVPKLRIQRQSNSSKTTYLNQDQLSLKMLLKIGLRFKNGI